METNRSFSIRILQNSVSTFPQNESTKNKDPENNYAQQT
jgi:hypothetical protein